MEERLKISEMYKTFQGEGRHAGRLCLFIRFYGCNFKCPLCDTKLDKFDLMPVDNILKEVEKYNVKDVVLTGGEPLLQPISHLIDELHHRGFRVHIETNGSCKILTDNYYHITVSPKVMDVDYSYWCRKPNTDFKIVVGNGIKPSFRPDHVERLVEHLLKYTTRDRIWLMPLGANVKQLSYWAKRTWDLALKLGVNYTDRIHIRVGRE